MPYAHGVPGAVNPAPAAVTVTLRELAVRNLRIHSTGAWAEGPSKNASKPSNGGGAAAAPHVSPGESTGGGETAQRKSSIFVRAKDAIKARMSVASAQGASCPPQQRCDALFDDGGDYDTVANGGATARSPAPSTPKGRRVGSFDEAKAELDDVPMSATGGNLSQFFAAANPMAHFDKDRLRQRLEQTYLVLKFFSHMGFDGTHVSGHTTPRFETDLVASGEDGSSSATARGKVASPVSVRAQWTEASLPTLHPLCICKEQLMENPLMIGVYEVNRLVYTGSESAPSGDRFWAHHLIGQGCISLAEGEGENDFVQFECALTKRGMHRGTLRGAFHVAIA